MKKPVCKYAKINHKMKNPCDGYIPVYAMDEMDEYIKDLQVSHYAENMNSGMANKKLQEEIAKLKAQMPEYNKFIEEEEFRKKLVDEYAGYVYDWKGRHYVATPYMNILIKGILYALWMSRTATASAWQVHFALCHNHSVATEFCINGSSCPSVKMNKLRTAREWSIIWKKVHTRCKAYAQKYNEDGCHGIQ